MLTEIKNIKRSNIYIAVFLIFFTELIIFQNVRIFNIRPDLLLIAVLFFGFNFGIMRGLEAGALIGILKDIFSIGHFGVNIFAYVAVGFISGVLKNKLAKENFLSEFFLAFSTIYITSGIYFLYLTKSLSQISEQISWQGCLYKALFTGLLAPVLFFILKKTLFSKEA